MTSVRGRGRAVAAIDVGTNSVLLLVARAEEDGLVPIAERATITRLGRGVDRTKRLGEAGIEASLSTLRAYVGEARGLGADAIAAVGTSALRDAENARDFLEPARAILGREVEVISGAREAELTFRGAVHGLDLDGTITVFDIGGGSTELVEGELPAGRIARAVSLDIGSVRLFERHVSGDPPSSEEIATVQAAITEALAASPVRPRPPLVGIAGTVTTLAAIHGAVEPYDPARIHGARLRRHDIEALVSRLTALPLAERSRLPGLDPKRADVIPIGALLVRGIVEVAGAFELVVSDGGVRFGVAAELAGNAPNTD